MLAMHRAQIEKLFAQRIAFALLREDRLKRGGELAKLRCLRPRCSFLEINGFGEQAMTAARAFVETREELIAEGVAQRIELSGFYLVAGVHVHCLHFARIAASTSSAVWGRAASRSISLPSLSTRKSHSMRTPSFSSGM